MEIRGKVHEIGQTQQVTDTFKKRDLIVAYSENPPYVEYIRFETTQERTAIIDNLAVGDEVEVFFNLRGRPWTNKDGLTTYFNSLVAWRINKVTGGVAPGVAGADFNTSGMPVPSVDITSDAGKDDDLPF